MEFEYVDDYVIYNCRECGRLVTSFANAMNVPSGLCGGCFDWPPDEVTDETMRNLQEWLSGHDEEVNDG